MASVLINAAKCIVCSEIYKSNIRKLERIFENEYTILGLADVRYECTRQGRVTGRPQIGQMVRTAGTKSINDEYRVLMAIRNEQFRTVNFIMMKRPASGKPVNKSNPLENCVLETSFQNNARGGILEARNLKIGMTKASREEKNEDENQNQDETKEYGYDNDNYLNIFTLENIDFHLGAVMFKTIYKIQILDTSENTIGGGWDGQSIKNILTDLSKKHGTKPYNDVNELRVH